MKKLTQKQIAKDLAAHSKWLRSEKAGMRIDWGVCNLDGASLVGAILDGANLAGASLAGASLVGARLDGARLDGAILAGARLDGAILAGASLAGASLAGASLAGASLAGASLAGASLDGASLDGASGVKNASCSWTDHGLVGRQLLAVRIDGEDVYFCGRFRGSIDELREYIKRGEEKHRASRTIAADFVSARMAEMKEQTK